MRLGVGRCEYLEPTSNRKAALATGLLTEIFAFKSVVICVRSPLTSVIIQYGKNSLK